MIAVICGWKLIDCLLNGTVSHYTQAHRISGLNAFVSVRMYHLRVYIVFGI